LKLFSRYIFNKTLIGFTGSISILISLIWFSRAIGFVKYVTENGIAIDQFFYLFVLILPWLLLFIIPISLMVSILVVYNRLITSNEMAILKNAGLTKFSLSKPAVYLTICCTIICFAISFYFMPYANKKLRLSRNDLRNNYTNLSINPQTFESMKSMTMYVKNRNEDNNLFGILLHDERNSEYSTTITAETGHIITQDNSALLYMENGTVQKFNYDDQRSEILHFDNYVFNLTEGEENVDKFAWKSKERYLSELINYEEDTPDYDIARFRTEIHQRFTYPLLPIVFAIISLACIMRGSFSRRGNSSNIILAATISTTFLFLTIGLYDLIESSPKFTPLLYLNFLLFFCLGIYFLNEPSMSNKNKSKT
jgi:lipopolysaccharide export system permease protein